MNRISLCSFIAIKFVYFVLCHFGWGRIWKWVYNLPMTFTILSGRWVGNTGCPAKSSTKGGHPRSNLEDRHSHVHRRENLKYDTENEIRWNMEPWSGNNVNGPHEKGSVWSVHCSTDGSGIGTVDISILQQILYCGAICWGSVTPLTYAEPVSFSYRFLR
jgi:hypothetical protein